jgi:hypothetical protein
VHVTSSIKLTVRNTSPDGRINMKSIKRWPRVRVRVRVRDGLYSFRPPSLGLMFVNYLFDSNRLQVVVYIEHEIKAQTDLPSHRRL